MKKTIFTIVLFSTLLITLFSCNNDHLTKTDEKKVCENYDTIPVSSLRIGLIKHMVDEYRTNKRSSVENTNRNDAHSIWFDLETLKAFIYHIESNVEENIQGNIKDEVLGLRIYYADYPKDDKWAEEGTTFNKDLSVFSLDNDRKKYGGMHTLIMIPTRRVDLDGGDFKDMDIDIENKNTYDKGLIEYTKNMAEVFDNNLPTLSGFLAKNNSNLVHSQSVGAQNHGSMIPPRLIDGEEAF